jgi:hypothetical protein
MSSVAMVRPKADRLAKRSRANTSIPVLSKSFAVNRNSLKLLSADNYEDVEGNSARSSKAKKSEVNDEDEYVESKMSHKAKKNKLPAANSLANSAIAAAKQANAAKQQINYSETRRNTGKGGKGGAIPSNAYAAAGTAFSVEASHKSRIPFEQILLQEFPEYSKLLESQDNEEPTEESELAATENDAEMKELNSNRSAGLQEKLNYFSAMAAPSNFPARVFCSVCGFSSKYNCTRCGMKYCSIRCQATHKDTRCLKFLQ